MKRRQRQRGFNYRRASKLLAPSTFKIYTGKQQQAAPPSTATQPSPAPKLAARRNNSRLGISSLLILFSNPSWFTQKKRATTLSLRAQRGNLLDQKTTASPKRSPYSTIVIASAAWQSLKPRDHSLLYA